MGHTGVSDIESSSVTLLTWRKEPEENFVISLILNLLKHYDETVKKAHGFKYNTANES